jgi:hypothetical protein
MIRLFLATLLAIQGTVATPRELPLWEVGAGLFPSTFPAYRGSDDQQYYLLPFPYLVYRGNYLRVDREDSIQSASSSISASMQRPRRAVKTATPGKACLTSIRPLK